MIKTCLKCGELLNVPQDVAFCSTCAEKDKKFRTDPY